MWLVNGVVQRIQDQLVVDLCLAWSGVVFFRRYNDHRIADNSITCHACDWHVYSAWAFTIKSHLSVSQDSNDPN